MKKAITILAAILSIVFFSQSCKKQDKASDKSLADKFAGTYLVYDTLIITALNSGCGDNISINSYLLVVSKQDDNTVILENFTYCAQIPLKLTKTTISSTSVNCPISGTYNSGKIFLSYGYGGNPSCSYDGKLTGVKQP